MKGYTLGMRPLPKRPRPIVAAALGLCAVLGCNASTAYTPYPAPEFTHSQAADWLNSKPLRLAQLRAASAHGPATPASWLRA